LRHSGSSSSCSISLNPNSPRRASTYKQTYLKGSFAAIKVPHHVGWIAEQLERLLRKARESGGEGGGGRTSEIESPKPWSMRCSASTSCGDGSSGHKAKQFRTDTVHFSFGSAAPAGFTSCAAPRDVLTSTVNAAARVVLSILLPAALGLARVNHRCVPGL
jgi:hypothetical protein